MDCIAPTHTQTHRLPHGLSITFSPETAVMRKCPRVFRPVHVPDFQSRHASISKLALPAGQERMPARRPTFPSVPLKPAQSSRIRQSAERSCRFHHARLGSHGSEKLGIGVGHAGCGLQRWLREARISLRLLRSGRHVYGFSRDHPQGALGFSWRPGRPAGWSPQWRLVRPAKRSLFSLSPFLIS
jgi:hypothetical protein